MTVSQFYVVALCLGSGVTIAGFWIFLIATERLGAMIPDRRVAAYHVFAEMISAAFLIVAAITRIAAGDGTRARILEGIALGTLVYALTGSPGLYSDKRMNAVFALGLAFAIPAVVLVFVG